MTFRKEITIYEKGKVRVFINQCHNPGKKTWLYSVRKDSSSGLGELLGLNLWKTNCGHFKGKRLSIG